MTFLHCLLSISITLWVPRPGSNLQRMSAGPLSAQERTWILAIQPTTDPWYWSRGQRDSCRHLPLQMDS